MHGEGPSTTKGKGVDPHNWGGMQLSDSDLDVEAQCAALESFANKCDETQEHVSSDEEQPNKIRTTHLKNEGSSRTPLSKTFDCTSVVPAPKVHDKQKAQLVKAARTNVLINQIMPKSYLGCMLDKIDKSEKSSRHRCQAYSSSSESSGSDSSLSSSSFETSSDSEDTQSDSSINSRRV